MELAEACLTCIRAGKRCCTFSERSVIREAGLMDEMLYANMEARAVNKLKYTY